MTTTVESWNGSTWDAFDDEEVLSITFIDGGISFLSSAEIQWNRSVLVPVGGRQTPTYQVECRIKVDGTVIFAGKIDKPESEYPVYRTVINSYGEEFLEKYVNEVFENESPEGIVEFIIDNYTNLTYASTFVSGVTIPRIVFRDKRVIEVLDMMKSLVDGAFYTNSDKEAFFERRASVDSGMSLEVGNNIVNLPIWEHNPDSVVTKVIVKGDKQEFQNSETFTATASQTVFTLAYEPFGNVNVTKNGTRQSPAVAGSGDYTTKPEDKQIILTVGATAGNTIVVTYAYKLPIKVEAEADVYDEYGALIVKEREIVNKAIKSMSEARDFASTYLDLHSSPSRKTTMTKYGFDIGADTGKRITAIDAEEGINEQFTILERRYEYPSEMTEYVIGTTRELFFDWHKEVIERIRDISQENSNDEKLQLFYKFKENINVNLGQTYTGYTRIINDTFIADHLTNGRARASRNDEPDCSGNGNDGTWNGTGITGAQYSGSGMRLGTGTYNGTDRYISSSASVTGARTACFWVKPTATNKRIISLASGAYIEINSGGDIATSGLTGVAVHVDNVSGVTVGTGSYRHVSVQFDSVTANQVWCGRHSTSYFAGEIDEFMLFDATLATADRQAIIDKTFYDNHAKWANCKIWWSMDDPTAGDKRGPAVTFSTG